MITLSVWSSYMLLIMAVGMAIIFAILAQKYAVRIEGQRKVNSLFWSLSYLALFLPAALRGNGVDQDNYFLRYQIYTSQGIEFIKNYRGDTEPLYLLANYLAEAMGGFQWVYILEVSFCLFFVYKALARKINDINLGIAMLMFSGFFYLFLYGLVRMSFAFGVVMYSFRYLEERNLKKYILCILVATGFHYSAISMLVLYIICDKKAYQVDVKKALLQILIGGVAIVGFFGMTTVIMRYNDVLPWLGRYSGYFEAQANLRAVFNATIIFPFLFILFNEGKYIRKCKKFANMYISMALFMIPIAGLSIFLNFGRLIFYLYPALFYLYSYVYQEMNNRVQKAIYLRGLVAFCLLWYLNTLLSGHWHEFLVPYVIGFK